MSILMYKGIAYIYVLKMQLISRMFCLLYFTDTLKGFSK